MFLGFFGEIPFGEDSLPSFVSSEVSPRFRHLADDAARPREFGDAVPSVQRVSGFFVQPYSNPIQSIPPKMMMMFPQVIN